MEKIAKTVRCRICDQITTLLLDPNDIKEWQEGAYVQDVFNYLTEGERELLISGICGTCFDNIFKEDE